MHPTIHPWQQTQWQQLLRQQAANKLPHALIFQGLEGLGKTDFALHLAHRLLCQSPNEQGHACGECMSCKLIAVDTHPDLFILRAAESGKVIKVDEVRQLSQKLNMTSQYGGYQITIIVDAHDMNINASNSLLKTLEEPSSDAILILVSANPQKLPITVRSRCQAISFSIPETSMALAWLQNEGVQGAEQLLNFAHGAPLLAMNLQQNELLDHHKTLIAALLNVANHQSPIEQAEQLHKLPLGYLLNGLFDWVQDLIKLHQCGDNVPLVHVTQQPALKLLVARSNVQALHSYRDQLIKNKQLQSISLNTQMLWEDLLLSWYNLLKRA